MAELLQPLSRDGGTASPCLSLPTCSLPLPRVFSPRSPACTISAPAPRRAPLPSWALGSSDPLWYHSPAPSPPAHTPTIEAVFIHIPSTQNFAQAPSALPIAPTLVFFIPIHLPHHSSNATSSRKPPLTSLPIPSYTLSVCDYLSLAPIHMIVGLTSYNYAIAL